jgi:hypothetical protein
MDPAVGQDQLPTLKEPKKPEAKDISQEALTMAQLDADGKELYCMLYQEYSLKLQEYRKREEALAMFHPHLITTIAESLLTYIYNYETPYDILKTLKDTFAQTTATREKEVIAW